MAETTNEKLLHDAIRHAIGLQQYSNGAVRKLIAILNASSSEIAAALASALQRLPLESFTVQRLDALLVDIAKLNTAAYARLADALAADMHSLTTYEVGYQQQLLNSVIPAQVLISLPIAAVNPEQVYAAAMARPFQGALLREWTAHQDATSMRRIRDAVRSGYVAQQTNDEIIRTIRGTRANAYSDGIMAIDRQQAESIVRTAISHTAGFARDTFMSENSDLVKAQQWVSTLDSRTSEPCILRDGKQYDNDTHKPLDSKLPWGAGPGRFHWNCRSTSVPVVRSFRDLGLNIDEFNVATRASMDGQVPSDLSYGEWLGKQSAARQDDVLGATRGKLFRANNLDVSRFANNKGRWLSLDELRAQDAELFAKAGL